MIKKIQIKNYKGIKKLIVLDFELGHLKPSQIKNESTFLFKDNIKAMAFPTFIAKNASGKTSILEAIEFAGTIHSIDDLKSWFLREFIDFKKRINSSFRMANRNFNRRASNSNPKEMMEWAYWALSRAIRVLNLGTSTEDNLNLNSTIEELNAFYEIFEKRVHAMAKMIIKHISEGMYNSSDGNVKELLIKILTTNNKDKELVIGEKLIFNGENINTKKLLNDTLEDFLSGNFVGGEFNKFKEYFEIISLDSRTNSLNIKKNNDFNIDINTTGELSLKRKPNEFILFNDSIIREQVSTIGFGRDWAGDSLINNFVKNYGLKISKKLIKAIDKSISHIELDKIKGTSILIDTENIPRPVSNLSFGTYKTIFLINEIYLAWANGKTLMIDELENGLNISLINLIVKFATSEKFSNDGFQVIATTHNPLLFTQGIINAQNAFVNISGYFERISSNTKFLSRSEDREKIFMPKNYFNEYFWLKLLNKNNESSNTIAKDDVFSLLDDLEDGFL